MINPKYPVYIVSKGRAKNGTTRKSLDRMGVPYYIAVEPQDYDAYASEIDKSKILVLPFSNHGDGPGRARNWCWDHSISLGAKRHWVLDDNIDDFYRLHKNHRIRVESGVVFRAPEDFVDRYQNIKIAGLRYRFFIPSREKRPPIVWNTRVYSCLLIDNECKHRWRGRYSEDTDICLRVLKDGDCTIVFNAFLQGKTATQTVKGGNTEEFYHKENKEHINKEKYNPMGTLKKSQMLVDMHPDVTTLVWRYGRVHHHVDYSYFMENNKPVLKDGINLKDFPKVNNYGMKFVKNWKKNT